MTFRKLFLLISIIGCGAPGAVAEEPSDTLGNVVITARREGSAVSVAAPVQTISKERMRVLGVTDMADAVRRFAGATVKDYGGIGGLKTVSVRNMGASHTAVSYDGVAMTNTQGGQIDIGRLSLDNVATLSLAIGAEPDMLRSARLHASAAVLSITTARPDFMAGRSTSVNLGIKGGAWATINPSIRIGQKIGNGVAWVDGNFLTSKGDYPFTIVNGSQTLKEKRVNSAIKSVHTEANYSLDTSLDGTLYLKAYYFWSMRGLPGAVTLYNPVSTERLLDRNFFAQARYRFSPAEKWMVEASGKYSYGFNLDHERGPEYVDGVYQSIHRQREYYVTASATFNPIRELTIALAQDGAIGTLTSTLSSCPFPKRYTSVSALSGRWRKGILTANATLTATLIKEHVKTGNAPEDISRLNPSVSVSVRPLQDRQFFLRAMYKRTFRAPSFTDLYYDRMGNRSLKPEDADEFNVGVTWTGSLFEAMDFLTVTADAYANKVTDKIVAFPSTYAWRMVNFGKTDISGIDVTLLTTIRLHSLLSMTISGAYSYQRAIDVTDPTAKNYRDQLPYTPRNSGNCGVTLSSPWVTLGYSLIGVGKRYYMSQNIPQNEIDGYVEQSVTLTREFAFRLFRMTLQAEVINLANTQYDVIKFYPMPGRSWRLTASFKF
ncbi:MAG: TonB-dependent receptor [Duncaniella sp.]|nr:TonB-dependent receptor [Duncaniella sp.]